MKKNVNDDRFFINHKKNSPENIKGILYCFPDSYDLNIALNNCIEYVFLININWPPIISVVNTINPVGSNSPPPEGWQKFKGFLTGW